MRPFLTCFYLFLIVLVSCSGRKRESENSGLFGIRNFISLLEYDLAVLEDQMEQLGLFTESLFSKQAELIADGDRNLYPIDGISSNSEPGADTTLSSLFVSRLAKDKKAVEDLILVTNPLDSMFKIIIRDNPVVSQVYFNSSAQLNRLYPPFNVNEMLEPDLDLTSFNFYYEAASSHNPTRGSVWVDEMYIDPVGRGWMITLVKPVYDQDSLRLVLGMDITLNEIIENYINKSNHQILIVDKEGTLVAGKSKTIEAFSLPTLKNHTYTQTITSDSYRKEDFNLFKSRSEEVRRVAAEIINERKNEVIISLGQQKVKIVGEKMKKLDWFVLEVFL